MQVKTDMLPPIIKWAGGKEKELDKIFPLMPNTIERYFEPFVGGGAVFAAVNAKMYFINDKSEELVRLYNCVASANSEFFDWASLIDEAWRKMAEYSERHSEVGDFYKSCRDADSGKCAIKEYLREHLNLFSDELDNVLPLNFVWKREVFFSEIEKNVSRKMTRMRTLEQEKGLLDDADVDKNIETAYKSSLYMYFRALYNSVDELDLSKALATALFLFVRNYAYSGMFRYNSEGEFNVPYGGMGYNNKSLRKKLEYYQSLELQNKLLKTQISNEDFEIFLRLHDLDEKDFIFLDPPYDSEFSTYAQNEFTANDQKRLADYLCADCPAKWLLVIKSTPYILSLYQREGIRISSFEKQYTVSFMNRNDKKAVHLAIRNYGL